MKQPTLDKAFSFAIAFALGCFALLLGAIAHDAYYVSQFSGVIP